MVSVSPNPSSDRIQIEADNMINIVVYNSLGAAVISENNLSSISNKSIDISSLANGAYFISIQTKEGNATRRIMKN